MKKTAFTMMELIFVIIVIGILAAVFIPRFSNNNLTKATNHLITNIRYTQHLALLDDQYNAKNATWYKKQWSINLCQAGYKISSLDGTRLAKDPTSKANMDGSVTNDFNLAAKYGVSLSAPAATCIISFDHLGRPYGFNNTPAPTAPTSNLLHTPVNITITSGSNTATIKIEPETGYVHLL